MKQVRVIMHGRHEHSRAWRKEWNKWQREAEYSLSIVYTQYSNHAIALAFEAVREEVDVLVAAGGDGTINQCVNGYMQANGKMPMSFLAMGTGNDFVKSLLQAGSWREVHFMIRQNKLDHVDVGLIEFTDENGIRKTRYFINVMDIGLGGEVVRRIAHSSRSGGPFFTYQKAVVTSLFSYKGCNVQFLLDNEMFQQDTLMLVVANAKWFGSGLGIAPKAIINDGILDVVHLGQITVLDYLLQLPKLRKCMQLQHQSISYYQSRNIEVRTAQIPIDCDGEFIGFTPLNCKVEVKKLKVFIR